MSDVGFVFVIVAFFALTVLFVHACDRIIGSEDAAFDGASGPATSTAVPAEQREAAA